MSAQVLITARTMAASLSPTFLTIILVASGSLCAAEKTEADQKELGDNPTQAEILAGHSYHGEYLNEGPRQKAYLMEGCGHVDFPVTSKSDDAKQFVEQGLGQFYGFWYLESERSFRHAAKLDPDCAMAYWGAALATRRNEKRAEGFIAEAVKRKDKVSRREQMYIDALNKYLTFEDKKQKEEKKPLTKEQKEKRAKDYTGALEAIALEFPEDIEAKAMLALQLYENRRDLPNPSYLAVDGLLDKVFEAQPMHSAHHFRIHLWDYKKPEIALRSATLCGQGSPSIAHMWHMPGHIFSRLKRYNDAAWQQEASARVDHAHMMRDRVLPDQIHNFAHNNEWLIRNLNNVGRAAEAVDLAKNMTSLPRHPKYNTLTKRGSAYYGRLRLVDTLRRYELWEAAAELCSTQFLAATSSEKDQLTRLRLLGTASFMSGDAEAGQKAIDEIQKRLDGKSKKLDEASRKAETDAMKRLIKPEEIRKAGEEARKKAQAEAAKKAEQKQKQVEQGADDSEPASEGEAAAEQSAEPAESAEGKDTEPAESDESKDTEPAEVAEKESPSKDQQSDPKDEAEDEESAKAKIDALVKQAEAARREELLKKHRKAIDKAKNDARRKLQGPVDELKRAIAEIETYRAISESKYQEALDTSKRAGRNVSTYEVARLMLRCGDPKGAIEKVKKEADRRTGEVIPLASLLELYMDSGDKQKAEETLKKLRRISSAADLDTPIMQRLTRGLAQLGFEQSPRGEAPKDDDVGERPDLDSLGPFRWSPLPAVSWTLTDAKGREQSLADYEGKPVVLVFYLGLGCLHCAEQLQALAPKAEEFAKAGIELLAISSEDEAGLQESIKLYDGEEMPFPLIADNQLETFRSYRVFDDFENQPLHGTFIIDETGRVRWQDVSYEPFMDVDFLLRETKRLVESQ